MEEIQTKANKVLYDQLSTAESFLLAALNKLFERKFKNKQWRKFKQKHPKCFLANYPLKNTSYLLL